MTTAGEIVRLTIEARLVKESYLWHWSTTLEDSAGNVRSLFDQSNLGSSPVLASQLRRHAETFSPATWKTKELDMAILGLIDGTRSNGAIASEVTRFADTYEAALDRVTELVDRLTSPKSGFR